MIAKCAYCIRKGEQPRPDRGNIFPWDMVKNRDTEFEPYLADLPVLNVPAAEMVTPVEKKIEQNVESEEASAARIRRATIVEAFKGLRPEDFGVKTKIPLADVMVTLTGIEDLYASEVKQVWEEEKLKEKG